MKLEDLEIYYSYYLEVRSITKVAKKFRKCTKMLAKEFKLNGFKYPNENFNRKHTLDDTFFEVIDTEIKAYLLGFIFADGCIHTRRSYKRGVNKSLSINLKGEDIEILNLFKKYLNYSGKLITNDSREFISPSGVIYTRAEQKCLQITSFKLVSEIEKYGISDRKTYSEMRFPELNETLIWHFIRGYMDGDGCICNYKGTRTEQYKSKKTGKITTYSSNYEASSVTFTSKKGCFLEELKEIISTLDIKSNIQYTKRRCYCYGISGKDNCIKFLDKIYENSNFYLERKYQKYAQLKSGELLEKPEEVNQQPSQACVKRA